MSMSNEPGLSALAHAAATIRAEIRSGALPPGVELPNPRYLAGTYGFGAHTVQEALQILCVEGLLDWKRGDRPTVRESTGRLTLTLQPGEELIVRMPIPEERERAGLSWGEPVLEVRRDGRIELYAASRTVIRAASPEDWNAYDEGLSGF